MPTSDEMRRQLAAEYLQGRSLEDALTLWRADYERQKQRTKDPYLTRLGTMIRRLAREAEALEDATNDHPGQRQRKR